MKYFSYIRTTAENKTLTKINIMAQNTLIYPSHYELMEQLSDKQAGLLIKTIGRYQRGEKISIDDVLVKGIWMGIKADFDKQKETYEAVCKRNKENGKKGGRPKNPKNPSGFSKTQVNPNNLKDKDKDKDKDKKKDINKDYSNDNLDTRGVDPAKSFYESFYSGELTDANQFLNQ